MKQSNLTKTQNIYKDLMRKPMPAILVIYLSNLAKAYQKAETLIDINKEDLDALIGNHPSLSYSESDLADLNAFKTIYADYCLLYTYKFAK